MHVNFLRAEVYINKGFIFYQKGNYNDALQNYDQAIQINPMESRSFRGRGQTKQAMNDMEGALNDYNMAISLYPSYDYYLNRALLKYVLNDFSGALTDLDIATQLNKSGYEAFFDKGLINLNNGNMTDAVSDFNKAITINAKDFEAYLDRAIAKYNLGDYNGTLADMDTSIQLNPAAKAYFYRGMANIQMGNKSDGCSDLKQAASMGNSDAASELQKNCK
jgi:tetratricopeptide (TPR) repeat protein